MNCQKESKTHALILKWIVIRVWLMQKKNNVDLSDKIADKKI